MQYSNTPYLPPSTKEYDMLVVKVYDSNLKKHYWIPRVYGNVNSVHNSYIHRKNWFGTVYCVYSYPSLSFIELLTYSDSGQRIILTDSMAESLAGNYKGEYCVKAD